jgi:phosphomannomutase
VEDPDEVNRKEIQRFIDEVNVAALQKHFGLPLTFGTAGLRGPVMSGPAGMNRLTVRKATQAVAAWLAHEGIDPARGVIVGRDARHGSNEFNEEVIATLIGLGVRVLEIPTPAPTPFVPYLVRRLEAAAGIMVTASHNPKQDNGYKLYDWTGSQIVPPHDKTVEAFMDAAGRVTLGERGSSLYQEVPLSDLESYYSLMAKRFAIESFEGTPITYSAFHGVGGEHMVKLFEMAGYQASIVQEQFLPDPEFPTLPFPNPEESGAMNLAIAHADAVGSRLILANDPDADRLGVAIRDAAEWRILKGDEIGWLLGHRALQESTDGVVATTIVSSTLLAKMAAKAGVECRTTLTGFKWIGRAGGDEELLFGYEEALGYAVDDHVGDKDGMSAALAIAHLDQKASAEGKSLAKLLDEIANDYGLHITDQLSIRFSGDDSQAQLAEKMDHLRTEPPASVGGLPVAEFADLAQGFRGLSATNGVWLGLGAAGRVVVRPSGTEPKLKVYIEIVGEVAREAAAETISAIKTDMSVFFGA